MFAGKEEGQRKGALESRQGLGYRVLRREPLIEKVRDQDRHRLGVGIGLEMMAKGGQFATQCLEILDDAVMDDRDPLGRDRMRVGLGRLAVRRPAGMADADGALDRIEVESAGEVGELAFGAAALDAAIDKSGDAGRIIAAVFEAAQPLDQAWRHCLFGDDADNAAHQVFPFPFNLSRCNRARISVARPGLTACCPRASVNASARHVRGDHTAGGDDRAVADRYRRHQSGVGADEGALADCSSGSC